MAVYGLAADQSLNKGSQLYIPGQTQLKAGDVFLGGAGTGISDSMLNGATRVAGMTAQDTAAAYGDYRVESAKNEATAQQAKYQQQLTDYQNQIAGQAAAQKQQALKQAWQSNQQGLNSQNATVSNNYNSATNKLNAVRDARLPEFQQQANSVSNDAQQTARKLRELMAASGRGDSGYSRSNQLSVDLNRSNALQGINSDKNQFQTDVGNQLSDVDAQRVAALNDIASKLQLGQRQYNDGTLSLTNQLESEKASGALKAMLEAQTWADQKSQQGLDNSYRDSQADQAAQLAQLQQAWQQKAFDSDQAQQGISNSQWDRTYALQQQQLEAETAYKNAALAKSGTKNVTQSSGTGKSNLAEAANEITSQLASGVSPGNIAASIESQRAALTKQGINVDSLIKSVWDKSGISNKVEEQDSWR